MNVISTGIKITAQNSLQRLRQLFVNIVTRAGRLLLKLPLASISFLSKIGNFLLDGKNRKVVAIILTTAALMVASRTLVSQANRKRLQRESSKLFSRFHSRFAQRLNLGDADDEDLLKAAWELEHYLKARHGRGGTLSRQALSTHNKAGQLMMLNETNEHRERLTTELESTVSGNSRDVDIRRLAHATSVLSNRPSVYQQTKHLDEIESILKKRKRSRYTNAEKFLSSLQVKKSEALASNILQESLQQRQAHPGFEQTISDSRQKIVTLNHLERIAQTSDDPLDTLRWGNRDLEDCLLSEDDQESDSAFFEDNQLPYGVSSAKSANAAVVVKQGGPEVRNLSKKSDQLFFEFFGMYTKESIKSQKQGQATR